MHTMQATSPMNDDALLQMLLAQSGGGGPMGGGMGPGMPPGMGPMPNDPESIQQLLALLSMLSSQGQMMPPQAEMSEADMLAQGMPQGGPPQMMR